MPAAPASKPTNGAALPLASRMVSSTATIGMPAFCAFSITAGPILVSGTTMMMPETPLAM